jgi:tripartite-type tricarboxylate transporter receptor subunit TctC
MKCLYRALAAFALVLAGADAALAQGWPNRPIRMVVPYTPGGYTDLMARLVGQKISDALGQPIVFENKPGANAIIGTDAVAKAAPDGYTFGTVIAAHAANATLNPKLPYDTLKDFTYVSLMSVAPLIMIAHPSVPANNVKELIALAKAKPGELNFASSGIGAAAHLTMEMFMSRTGIKMQHIPYKGTAGALQDTVGGQINVMFDIVGPLMPQVRSGNAKAIVVTAKERVPAASDVPTMAERECRISCPAPGPESSRRQAHLRRSSTASRRRPRRHSPIRHCRQSLSNRVLCRWAAPRKNSAPSSPRRSRDGER